jgi:hypothetical protein
MNPEDANRWKADVLMHILKSLASSNELKDVLIYKGALILNHRLGTSRMSLDIDTNLNQDFIVAGPHKEDRKEYLKKTLSKAINKYFERQEPVRFKLENINIRRSPPRIDHPLGWDAYTIKINIMDNQYRNIRNLPALTIDVAAPEALSEYSVSDIDLDGYKVKAYTLERIAGEKLRAFLSTLPAYRAKVSKPGEAVRVKDLYDIVRIYRICPIENKFYWEQVGSEFKLACESRFVDCQGLESFQENWTDTRSLYERDTSLPKDIPFDEIERVIVAITDLFTGKGIIPFSFQLPTSSIIAKYSQ